MGKGLSSMLFLTGNIDALLSDPVSEIQGNLDV